MIFWRIYNNNLYSIQETENLGFNSKDPSFIPDEYLKNQEFVILRTAFGIGDQGIISSMPRLLKEKYPRLCNVYTKKNGDTNIKLHHYKCKYYKCR